MKEKKKKPRDEKLYMNKPNLYDTFSDNRLVLQLIAELYLASGITYDFYRTKAVLFIN